MYTVKGWNIILHMRGILLIFHLFYFKFIVPLH
jgi:hypothetical protein